MSKAPAKPERQTPPSWATDPLSAFLQDAYKNRLATFANKREKYSLLAGLDQCFIDVAKDWLNPQNEVSALLFLRAHAAFRASCEHATSGQVAEVFPMIRTCIEYAAYALHISKTPGLDEVWLRRHDSEQALKAVKSAFHPTVVLKSVEASNRKAAKVFDSLYERSIDMGAHPNERAVTGSLDIVEMEGRRQMLQKYLHGDGIQMDHALQTTAQAGVCALEILQDVFPARFELLGVRHKLLELRKGLQ
jgi:hypothetical protein